MLFGISKTNFLGFSWLESITCKIKAAEVESLISFVFKNSKYKPLLFLSLLRINLFPVNSRCVKNSGILRNSVLLEKKYRLGYNSPVCLQMQKYRWNMKRKKGARKNFLFTPKDKVFYSSEAFSTDSSFS